MVTVMDPETQMSQSTGGRYCEGCPGLLTIRPRCANNPARSIRTCIQSAVAAATASSETNTVTTHQT